MFFETEQEVTAFVEGIEKKLSADDVQKLKLALGILGKIENLPADAKAAIATLAKLAGDGSTEKPKTAEETKVALQNKLDEVAGYKETIDGLVEKVKALEEKVKPQEKRDIFRETLAQDKKKE